jgi:hypothetical protein
MDPLAKGGLGQVEVLGDLGDAAVADPTRRTASALTSGVNVRRGRFLLTVFAGFSMEHSW